MIPRLKDRNGYPIGELIGASIIENSPIDVNWLAWWLLYCVSVEV